jgi:hypothetical protein
VDSSLTALYLLINGREDLRWEFQQAAPTCKALHTLQQAFSLMVEKKFEAAKRLWSSYCGISSNTTEWWGELLNVLYKPLSVYPFFGLQQTMTNQ